MCGPLLTCLSHAGLGKRPPFSVPPSLTGASWGSSQAVSWMSVSPDVLWKVGAGGDALAAPPVAGGVPSVPWRERSQGCVGRLGAHVQGGAKFEGHCFKERGPF